MNRLKLFVTVSCTAALLGSLPPAEAGNSLASSMDIYIFPKAGQQAAQQSQDEAACYEWAVSNSGVDPFELQKQAQAQQQEAGAQAQQASQAGRGSGARGAVGGAAVGALIGEVADDDAGKGAAYGAAIGAIRGRRQGAAAQQSAQSQVQQQSAGQQQNIEQNMLNFKKAFSVCMEAKEYLVKF
jgi:hypothetical protein